MVGYGWGLERFSRSRNNSGLIAIFLNFRGSLDADFRDTVIGEEGEMNLEKFHFYGKLEVRYNSNVLFSLRVAFSSRFLKNFLFGKTRIDIIYTIAGRDLYKNDSRDE